MKRVDPKECIRQDVPLYCFRLDPETGELTRYEVWNYYTVTNFYSNKKAYKFRGQIGANTYDKYTVKFEDLNRFAWFKLFTFDPDMDKARQLILADLDERIETAYREAHKWFSVRDLMLKGEPECTT